MKKKICSKILTIFLIFSGILSFSSCGKKVKPAELEALHQMQDVVFELVCYSLTGRCNLEKPEMYYNPPNITLLANYPVYVNGEWIRAIEKYYPEKLTVIDCLSFYNPYDEKADWVDDLIIQVEEERIAQEITDMEDELTEGIYEPGEYEQQIEEALSEEKSEKYYVGKDSQLKIMEFDQEIFIPVHNEDSFVLIDATNGDVKRSYFDGEYRLLKKETWKANNANDAKLMEQEDYEFNEDEFRPCKKTVRSETKVNIYTYNDSGLVLHSENYDIVERTVKKKTVKEDVLIAVYDWTYNEDDKVETEICRQNFYDEDYKKIEYTFVKKHIYTYNDFGDEVDEDDKDNIPPDFEYYEDDVLKMKNKYSAEMGTYTSQVFFENDYSVKTYYEKYKRVKDVYTVGKKVKRIKEYE